jgi:predicted transcriptional regulator
MSFGESQGPLPVPQADKGPRGHYPLKSSDKPVAVAQAQSVSDTEMMQPKLTDEITVKLADGFRARLDRVAAHDRRKPGQWARKVLEEAVEDWERAHPRDEWLHIREIAKHETIANAR